MATGNCVYCGRTLDLTELSEKAGSYRCKDEDGCLDYQAGGDAAAASEDPDYWTAIVSSFRSEALRRVAAYRAAKEDADGAAGPQSEFTWIKAMIDLLAVEYREETKFSFRHDENAKGREYRIIFNDPEDGRLFRIRIGSQAGSRYALSVAKVHGAADPEELYQEFIYKSYPGDRREEVVKDLSVILTALEQGEGLQSVLSEFRREIESIRYP